MHRASSDMADEQVDKCLLPRPTANEDVDEPGVEESETDDLGPPPPSAAIRALRLESSLH